MCFLYHHYFVRNFPLMYLVLMFLLLLHQYNIHLLGHFHLLSLLLYKF